MPLMGGARKRSRGNTEQADGTQLKGWNFIQEKLLSHDEDMIADYADDIDTLLVFAGLFSAVLTAFLVISLALLQPDNSQITTQILSVIAVHIGAPTDAQQFLDKTAQSIPTSTAFKAPTNVATINTLWFTSLVLSLAAALFGILAKQWCREYLRWHSVIATARENVLIRQVRFDAWERWQVGAFIAFIPAFLEIALVLFLVGLLIFVPTYSERSMTVVLSVVIGSVLLGVLVLTILPVFFRLCPFQTPTGWAFVRLVLPVRWAFWQLSKWVAVLFDHSLHGQKLSWIRDDVDRGSRLKGWSTNLWLYSKAKLSSLDKLTNWRAYGLHSVQAPELCKAVPAASDIKQACEDIRTNIYQAAIDAVQTCTLFRTLTWVRLGSNDGTVLAAIQEAIPTIHATVSSTVVCQKSHFLSAIHAICPTDMTAVLKMVREYFYDIAEGSLSFRAGPQSPFRLWDIFGPFVDARECGLEERHRAVCETWADHPVSLEVSHSILRSDLSSLVDDWLALPLNTRNDARKAIAERIILLICILRILPSGATVQAVKKAGPRLTFPLAKTLEEVYRKLAPHRAAYEDGLVSVCVEMCRLLGPAKFDFEGGPGNKYGIRVDTDSLFKFRWLQHEAIREFNMVSTWATVAVDIHHNTNHYEDANGRHLFVTLVSRVFETIRLRVPCTAWISITRSNEAITPMIELFSCMVDALRWSLVHSQPNCGAYISLPWVKDIRQCYQAARYWERNDHEAVLAAVPLTGDEALRSNFLLILRLLKTCIDRDLIVHVTEARAENVNSAFGNKAVEASAPVVVETPASEFERLLKLLGRPKLPHLPGDLILKAAEVQQLARRVMSDGKPVYTACDLPDELIPEWLWLLSETSTPAAPSDAQLTTSSVGETEPDADTTSQACLDDDDAERMDQAAREDAMHLVEDSAGTSPPPDRTRSMSPSAPGPDEKHQQDMAVASALLEPPSAPETMHRAAEHEMLSPREGDEDPDTPPTRPATVPEPAVGVDPWYRSTEIHVLDREPQHRIAQTSATADTTLPYYTNTNFSVHTTRESPPEIGSDHSASPATNFSFALREAGHPSTHHPPLTTTTPLSQPAMTAERGRPTETTQATTNALSPLHPHTPREFESPPSSSSRSSTGDIELRPLTITSRSALEINGTERDLEAGPPIPSPVSDGPAEV